MRRLLALALVGAMFPHAQTATIHPVTGRLLDGSGRALAGRPILLTENRGLTNDIVGSFAAVFSLGLSCIAGADPCRSSGSAHADTDATGAFTFSTAAVQHALGHSQGLVLSAGDAASGGVTIRLNPSLGGDLGDINLWEPHVTVNVDGPAVTVGWTSPPSSDGNTEVLGSAGVPVVDQFRTKGAGGQVALDRRGWEDRPAPVRLGAGFHRPRANQNPRIDWLTAPYPLPGAGVPISRGAPCSFTGRAALQSCPLTDGELFAAPPVPPCVGGTTVPCPLEAVIDLGRAVQADSVVIRPAGAVPSVSSDGSTWRALIPATPAGQLPGALFDGRGSTFRYLKVAGAMPAEVSVWPGTAFASTPPSSVSTPTAGAPAQAAGPRSSPRHVSGWVTALALILLGVVGGVVLERLFEYRRRRARRDPAR